MMTMAIWTSLLPVLPELFLFAGAALLLLLGLYSKEEGRDRTVAALTLCLLAGAAYLLSVLPVDEPQLALGGMLRMDGLVKFSQMLVLAACFIASVLCQYWLSREAERKFEFHILLLLSAIGMMLMIAAHHMLAVYMALELTSLPLYVLAAYRRNSAISTEAGLKYFVLGSLASGMMLFGISLIYGFTGTLSFEGLAQILPQAASAGMEQPAALGILTGLILLMTGFCFKVSAVPFHMWTPDVYEGAPTPVTAFFASAPKIAALVLFARILLEPFGSWIGQWQQVILLASAASMAVGALAALNQRNIKRLLAYSSIGHVGYALMGVAAGTQEGVQGVLVYLSLYLFMSLGVFGCVLVMQRGGDNVEDIDSLAGLSKRHPYFAMLLALFMFSLAGIPPLAGFFGKFYVFLAAMKAGLTWLAVFGVVSSVVAAFYYLRIVKLIYFDEEKDALNPEPSSALKYAVFACAAVTGLFFLMPSPLVAAAGRAASALWQ